MEVRKLWKGEFYNTYSRWLQAHNFPVIEFDRLPQVFFVVFEDEIPLYAMPFYETDSVIALIAFMASNKSIEYSKRKEGKQVLLNGISEYAKGNGYLQLFSPTDSEIVIEALEENGFVLAEKGSQMFKNL